MKLLVILALLATSIFALSDQMLCSDTFGPKAPITYRSNFDFTFTNVHAGADTNGIQLYKPVDSTYWIRATLSNLTNTGSAVEHSLTRFETGYFTNGTTWVNESDIANRPTQPTVWEYAINLSSDAGAYAYVGNGHGYDYEDSIALTVDGVSKTLNPGDFWTGTNATLTRMSHFVRTDINTNILATNAMVYTVSSSMPMALSKSITWNHTVSVNQFYCTMFVVDNKTNSMFGGGDLFSGAIALTVSNDSVVQDARQHMSYVYWGNYAVCQYTPSYSAVDWFGYVGRDNLPLVTVGIQQRGLDKKMYISEVNGAIASTAYRTFSAGNVWSITTYYDFLRSTNVAALFP